MVLCTWLTLKKGNYGTNGIVLVGGYALAVGAALTQQYKGNRKHCCGLFGDGYATNEGSFHESVNMAATWKCRLSSLSSITVMISQWIFIKATNTPPPLYTCGSLWYSLVSTVKMVTMFWLYTEQWARLLSMSVWWQRSHYR